MFLRFENDIPVYSFNESETDKLIKLAKELDKSSNDLTSKEFFHLFEDKSIIKSIDIIIRYWYTKDIQVEYPKELQKYIETEELFIRFFFMLYYYSDMENIPVFIKKEIDKFDFELNLLDLSITVSYKPGIILVNKRLAFL